MKPAVTIAGAGLFALLVYLLLPEGVIALIGFELLIIVVAWMAIRRMVPTDRRVETTGRPFGPLLRRRGWQLEPMLPMSLRKVENLIRYSKDQPFAVHHNLLPAMRGLAAERLASHHGVDMTQDPDAAAELLGAAAWSVLDPQAAKDPALADHGIDHDGIDVAVTAIEQL